MTQKMNVLLLITISLFFITSCDVNNSNKNDKNDNDSISVNNQDSGIVKNNSVDVKTFGKADLKVRLFFTRGENEEEYEIKDFNTKKTYTFCYDSETFSKVQIDGNADNITFIVKPLEPVEDKTFVIIKQENFAINGKKIYTNKDFDFNTNEIRILIYQNKEILFDGSVKSEGCM